MRASRFATGARVSLVALVLLACAPRSTFAQLSRVGTSVEVIAGAIGSFRGVDGAYDPRNDAYLMVGGNNAIYGVCVGPTGVPIAAPFTIKALGGPHGAFPRARYSRDINNGNGGFLVAWVGEAGSTGWGPVYSSVVSCTAGILSPPRVIDPALAFLESAPAIAYSETSKRFLVVWKGGYVTAKVVDNAGTGIGEPALLSTHVPWTRGRDPGVTWNPVTDDFGVSYSTETSAVFARVPASNHLAFARNTIRSTGTVAIYITDIDFNLASNTYLMTWWENGLVRVSELDGAGTLLGTNVASGTLGSYDALSIAANNLTGTYLVVGVDHPPNGANTDAVIATELNLRGVPLQGEMLVSTSTPPARHPRVVGSSTSKHWNVSWSGRTFSALINQVVQSAAVGGPGPGPGPRPPAPATSAPRMSVDSPANGARVSSNGFGVGGWAIDAAAVGGTGVDAVHVWAHPTNGAPAVFAGVATIDVARPDVGAAFGQTYFTNSGFRLNARVPPGTYDLVVYARSTVAGTFNNLQSRRVTVEAPVSAPAMWVDTPAANDNLSENVWVAGWALDGASTTNSGVDAVHVWAYPINGHDPVFVGAAQMGGARPDVGAAFGSARFNNSGFDVRATVPKGIYTLVVFARSSVANAFNNVFTIPVHVR